MLKRRGQIKGFVEDVKSNEQPKPLLLIGLIVLAMITSLRNIVISGVHLTFMGTKFLIKMTRLQTLRSKNNVLQPGCLYQKFDPISIRRS